ncbi:MAG: phenylacetate--CoA ligase family protein [Kiloniellales bacterium]
MRSQVAGIAWPAVLGGPLARVLALLQQLDQSQWWSAERLAEAQLAQAAPVLRYASARSPFFARRFGGLGLDPDRPLDAETWRSLPLLTRRDIQATGEELFCDPSPREHGAVGSTQTSGSTGQPVTVRKTGLANLFWQAITLREHDWHCRDVTATIASIRAFDPGKADPPDGLVADLWPGIVGKVYSSGRMGAMTLGTDISLQVDWLLRLDPAYLLTYPSNLRGLLEAFRAGGTTLPKLHEIRTIGETVSDELRRDCRNYFGAKVTDLYSSQEIGYLALQCPDSGLYHIQAEDVMLEVLDAEGRPCRPGEIGRVVATALHNFATPLIRYEIRDYAEVGPPCSCGRGLPTLRRVVGRQRNLLVMPSGERRWPLVGFKAYRDIAPIAQYQIVQKSLERIEVRLVAERPVTAEEEAKLGSLIQGFLGHPFALDFVYRPDIPQGPGGKFEEFISEVA